MVQILNITESWFLSLVYLFYFQVRLEAAVCLHAGLRHRLWTLPGPAVAQRFSVARYAVYAVFLRQGCGALLRIEIQ